MERPGRWEIKAFSWIPVSSFSYRSKFPLNGWMDRAEIFTEGWLAIDTAVLTSKFEVDLAIPNYGNRFWIRIIGFDRLRLKKHEFA